MYVAKLLTLIHVIWLKGSRLTYVAKKLMNFVMLVDQGVKVNWSVIVFNNLYNKLQNLFTSTKFDISKDNIEFGIAQMVDILLYNWFMIDLTFILLELWHTTKLLNGLKCESKLKTAEKQGAWARSLARNILRG